MRVTMNHHISGTRDGAAWPARGESNDLPDAEADALIAQGAAIAADEQAPGEQATETPKGRRGRKAPAGEQATNSPAGEQA